MNKRNDLKIILILSFIIFNSCRKNIDNIIPKSETALIKTFYSNGILNESGALIDSMKQGYWIKYDNSGNLEAECIYLNDTLNGNFNLYYPSGKLKVKGFMFKNNWHGERTMYYSNSNIMDKGKYKEGKLDSIWHFYDEKGSLDKKIKYENDKVIKVIEDNKLTPSF